MHPKRKLFIGLSLSPPLRKRLARETAAWPREAMIVTDPQNLHVTLFYIGYVQDEVVPDICARAEEACAETEPFELSFSGLEFVEDAIHPKMIWLTGEKNSDLKQLRENLEKSFDAFVTAKKAYRPHVLLAKIKRAQWAKRTTALTLPETLRLVEPVDTASVFESITLDGKRRYEPIDSFPLGRI